MDFVTPIIAAVKLIWDPLSRHLHYVKDVKENVKVLVEKIAELTSIEDDVKGEVDNAKLQGKSPNHAVTYWLEKVNEVKKKVNGIEKEFEENHSCLKGCFPNYCLRWNFGKQTLKLKVVVDELISKGTSIEGCVAADRSSTTIPILPTTSLVGTTTEITFKSIWDCLTDEPIVTIGVYGMGGVGKTTIMKNIVNQLREKKIFSSIIMVTVSQDIDLKRLQCNIAEQIGLELPNSHDVEMFSRKLYAALLQKKNFLLILDDLWCRLSLEHVGVPELQDGCKVVLTTRSIGVCRCMETQKNIEVKTLSQEESWSLFQEKIGTNALMSDSDVEDVAKQVAKECGGLPLALITVGRALRDVGDVREWRNALKQLKDSTADIPGMEDGVFGRLKFSFDSLRNEKLRACFLYCSLFPEDYNINAKELIDHWIWNGLIIQMENKQAEVDSGCSLLNELSRACMLECDDGFDTVKMHDMKRDMAIGITRHKPRFMVKAGMGLDKPLVDNEWSGDIERISLMNNNIKRLSGQPRCLKLQTLLLNRNPLFEIIPHSFFDNMQSLQVLELSETRIKMLPESLSNLQNLHVLLLRQCSNLKMMPSLAKLKKLKVLHLSSMPVKEIPESLTCLENLLELHLQDCWLLISLPSFANLRKLRSLDLSHASIEELPEHFSNLENLTNLNISLCHQLKMVPSLANVKKMKDLDLSNTNIKELPESVSDLENLQSLSLACCENLKKVPPLRKLQQLRYLSLASTSIEELPEGMERLVALETLDLDDTERLKRFPIGILAKLSLLKYFSTQGSSCLWSSEMARTMEGRIGISEITGLTRLTRALFDCCDLSSFSYLTKSLQINWLELRLVKSNNLSTSRNFERNTIFLRRRRYVSRADDSAIEISELHDMICLSEFLSDLGLMELLRYEIRSCGRIRFLLLGRDNNCSLLHNAIDLKIMYLPNLESVHTGTTVQGTLASLRVMEVFGCFKLQNLFPIRLLQNLQCLESIVVNDCYMLEELVEGEDVNTGEHITLPNFQRLETLASLTKINVSGCPKLRYLLPHWLLHSLKSLKSIYVERCGIMEELVAGEDINTGEHITVPNFQRLQTLASLKKINVSYCPKLRYLLPHWLLQSLKSLEYIFVKFCDTMEELVAGEDANAGEHVALPNFEGLELVRLKALKSICSRLIKCDSVKNIVVKQCPHLKKIPLCIHRLPHNFRGSFEGKKEWWDTLCWDDPTNTRLLLQPFFEDEEASQEKESNQERQKEPTEEVSLEISSDGTEN